MRLREGLKGCYDLGVVLGVIGMIVACGGSLWVVYSHASSLLHWWSMPTSSRKPSQPGLLKRDTTEAQALRAAESIPIRMIVRLTSVFEH